VGINGKWFKVMENNTSSSSSNRGWLKPIIVIWVIFFIAIIAGKAIGFLLFLTGLFVVMLYKRNKHKDIINKQIFEKKSADFKKAFKQALSGDKKYKAIKFSLIALLGFIIVGVVLSPVKEQSEKEKVAEKQQAELRRLEEAKRAEKEQSRISEQEKNICKVIILEKIMKVHSKWLLVKEKEIDNNKFIVMASNPVYPPLKPIWLLENRKIYSINGAAKTLTPEFPFTYIIDPGNAVEILEENKPYRSISHETETVSNTKPTPPIPGREVIGRWWEGMPFNCIEEIYKEKNKYYLVYKLDNGGLVTKELTKKGKNTFKVIDSRAGDYFVITENNDLESGDNDGLISTAKPIK